MSDELQERITAAVRRRLERVFDEACACEPSGLFPPPAGSLPLEQARELTLRSGKRLRAVLLVCGAALFDRDADRKAAVIDAAAALELLHTYFLIHDDIMDEDATRRGGPSAHVALARQTGDDKLGRDLAILAGDLAVALHEQLVAGLEVDEARRRTTARVFSEMHFDVVHGQTLDMLGGSDAEEVASRKTASYTTVGPLVAGAALAGAGEERFSQLAELARPLGVAFQLRDDLLGVFGLPEVTGKPVGTDLRLGKRTYVIQEALRRASAKCAATIESVLGDGSAPASAIGEVGALLEEIGARSACEERIERLVGGALERLESESYLDEGKRLLAHVGERLARRIS
ncbi:MAG: polyprenyl synthetase family protein [Polyangia bacterium]